MKKSAVFQFSSGGDIKAFAMLAACALALGGCVSNPIPVRYTGPVARIADSVNTTGSNGVNFFYLAKINGKKIGNSLTETAHDNAGRGFSMDPVRVGRDVPARAAVFTITGRTHYAAPILELMHTVYEVSGNVRFTPQPNHSYEVRGILSDAGSSVWIEDETGAVMDKKITSKHSALGIFQK